jgi:DNA-binding MarR family transcriptional regulator
MMGPVAAYDPTDLATPGTTRGIAACALVLRAATEVVGALHDGLAERGYPELRPSHLVAFLRVAAGEATVVDVAHALGVTKQSASQLVDHLVVAGHLSRHPDLADGRVWRLRLTPRGRAALEAADEVCGGLTARWRGVLGDAGARQLLDGLAATTTPGPLRPTW